MESVAYFCAKLITELLLRTPQTPVVTAVRAAVVTAVGKAPNQRVAESKLAVALAQSDLLSRVSLVPIYGDAPVCCRVYCIQAESADGLRRRAAITKDPSAYLARVTRRLLPLHGIDVAGGHALRLWIFLFAGGTRRNSY